MKSNGNIKYILRVFILYPKNEKKKHKESTKIIKWKKQAKRNKIYKFVIIIFKQKREEKIIEISQKAQRVRDL